MTRMTESEFKEQMRALPMPPAGHKPPYWEAWRHELWKLGTDPNSDPTQFFGWPPIYHTMLVNHWIGPVFTELHALSDEYRAEVTMPHFGAPPDYHGNTAYSRNLIHQAYHLSRLEAVTGVHVRDLKRIDEFGGGYGAMAHMVHRLGFRGKYHIYDLPEFALMQRYYLSQFGVPVRHFDEPSGETDLLIACYSLSETSIAFRSQFIDSLPANNYLLLYSNRFAEYDNEGYFSAMQRNYPQHLWHYEHIEHLPPKSIYAFGHLEKQSQKGDG